MHICTHITTYSGLRKAVDRAVGLDVKENAQRVDGRGALVQAEGRREEAGAPRLTSGREERVHGPRDDGRALVEHPAGLGRHEGQRGHDRQGERRAATRRQGSPGLEFEVYGNTELLAWVHLPLGLQRQGLNNTSASVGVRASSAGAARQVTRSKRIGRPAGRGGNTGRRVDGPPQAALIFHAPQDCLCARLERGFGLRGSVHCVTHAYVEKSIVRGSSLTRIVAAERNLQGRVRARRKDNVPRVDGRRRLQAVEIDCEELAQRAGRGAVESLGYGVGGNVPKLESGWAAAVQQVGGVGGEATGNPSGIQNDRHLYELAGGVASHALGDVPAQVCALLVPIYRFDMRIHARRSKHSGLPVHSPEGVVVERRVGRYRLRHIIGSARGQRCTPLPADGTGLGELGELARAADPVVHALCADMEGTVISVGVLAHSVSNHELPGNFTALGSASGRLLEEPEHNVPVTPVRESIRGRARWCAKHLSMGRG